MAGSEQPGRKIRTWLTGRFGEMRLAEMGTLHSVTTGRFRESELPCQVTLPLLSFSQSTE
jgi:hypothetical protein